MKTSSFFRTATVATALFITSTTLQAHQLVLGANDYLLTYPSEIPGALTVYVYASFGHKFPIDEPLTDERFGGITLLSPGSPAAPVATAKDGYRSGMIELARTGVYWLTSVNRPMFSTRLKNAAGKMEYVAKPKNEVVVPKDRTLAEGTLINDCGKTLIYVAGASPDETWLQKPVGQPIEIVPLANPATLAKGDVLPVQVWLHGKPYQGDPIEIAAEHVVAPYIDAGLWTGKTDKNGQIKVPLALPGVWKLLVIVSEPAPKELVPRADVIRYRATLTFEVPGAKKIE